MAIYLYDLGTTPSENSVIINNAINESALSGETIILPNCELQHNGLIWKSGASLTGGRLSSLKYVLTTGISIDFTGVSNAKLSSVSLIGSATVTWPTAYPNITNYGTAMKFSGCSNIHIDDIKISYFGVGIDYQLNGGSDKRCTFTHISGEFVYKGIYTNNSGEYASFSDCHFTKCYYGFHVDSGNNTFVNCSCTMSGVAVKLSGGANNGHGQFIGCTFNHNNYNLSAYDAVSLGESFVGCHFLGSVSPYGNAGIINITNCKGIIITGGQIGSNITIDGGANTQNGLSMFNGCLIRTDIAGYVAPNIINGGITPSFKNNITLSGLFSGNN